MTWGGGGEIDLLSGTGWFLGKCSFAMRVPSLMVLVDNDREEIQLWRMCNRVNTSV